jgi:hypothetical protein
MDNFPSCLSVKFIKISFRVTAVIGGAMFHWRKTADRLLLCVSVKFVRHSEVCVWRNKPYLATVWRHMYYVSMWRHTKYSASVWRHSYYSDTCDSTHSIPRLCGTTHCIPFSAAPQTIFCICVAPQTCSTTVWPHKPYSAATGRRFKQGYQSKIVRGSNESFSEPIGVAR